MYTRRHHSNRKLKAQAVLQGILLKDIAAQLRSPTGTRITQQRFWDMINGDPRRELWRYKEQIADILGTAVEEIFDGEQ